MKVLHATLSQKKALEGTYLNGAVLQFIQDKNNNWVVNDNILHDDNFSEIHVDLKQLPLINFEPIIVDIK